MSNTCYVCGTDYPSGVKPPVRWTATVIALEVVDDPSASDSMACCMSCNNRIMYAVERLRNKFQPHNVFLSENQMLEGEKELGPIIPRAKDNDQEDLISGS